MLTHLFRRLRHVLAWAALLRPSTAKVPVPGAFPPTAQEQAARPPPVPAHVPLVPHRQSGHHSAEPPEVRLRKMWRNAKNAAVAMARAYPHDTKVQRHRHVVVTTYERMF